MEIARNYTYLALLRGINVGGNNIIKMADLKNCFESLGFKDVVTYIQSGNVIFGSSEQDKAKLIASIGQVLSDRFNYTSKIVLVDSEQLKMVINTSPPSFGQSPEEFKYDVVFLIEPLTVDEAYLQIKGREGVDIIQKGKEVLYFSRLNVNAGKSYLSKIVTLPIYKNMTIRNWNTTFRLFELMK